MDVIERFSMGFHWPLMKNNIRREDLQAVIDFLKGEPRLTQSENVAAFEKEWSEEGRLLIILAPSETMSPSSTKSLFTVPTPTARRREEPFPPRAS